MQATEIDERTALVVCQPAHEIEFVVVPADEQRLSVWLRCRDAWLAAVTRRAKGSACTRKAYENDYRQFFAFFETWRTPLRDGTVDVGLKPWQVGGAHVMAWVEHLYAQGLRDSTVNRKLAALSSFYQFAMYKFSIQTDDGARALWQSPNPFKVPDRVQVQPYGRSVYPAPADVEAILREIQKAGDTPEIQRLRDRALIGGMYLTTRRVSEWRTLTWGKIHENGDGVWFEYRYKGGKVKRQAIPAAAWRWLRAYLEADGRWGQLAPEDFVFLATTDSAKLFRGRGPGRGNAVDADYDRTQQPLSAHRVNDLLKKYGRRAGVPEELLHAHGLRHAGARARKADGADVHELMETLGHGNISITQIYTDAVLVTPVDARGEHLGEKLDRQIRLL